MALPLFFYDGSMEQSARLMLQEDTAKHVTQVLRMQPGDHLQLSNGRGHIVTATITRAEKKKCEVAFTSIESIPKRIPQLHLGVAFTKNPSRNEWLLEKATELGASSIIPIVATRSEKTHFKAERWRNILVAASIQSRQAWLPELPIATNLNEILQQFNWVEQKLIGHCREDLKRILLKEAMVAGKETLLLIGPEGDFTPEEINRCMESGFVGVHLGTQRLRTETAAMVCAAFFNLINSNEG